MALPRRCFSWQHHRNCSRVAFIDRKSLTAADGCWERVIALVDESMLLEINNVKGLRIALLFLLAFVRSLFRILWRVKQT